MGRKRISKKKSMFIIFFLVGVLFGVGASFFVTRNDCFIMNGSKNILLDVNDTYVDQGVKVIAFGKDVSSDVEIIIYDENDEEVSLIDTSKEGEFTIIYTIDTFKWSEYKLIRRVIIGGDSNE